MAKRFHSLRAVARSIRDRDARNRWMAYLPQDDEDWLRPLTAEEAEMLKLEGPPKELTVAEAHERAIQEYLKKE